MRTNIEPPEGWRQNLFLLLILLTVINLAVWQVIIHLNLIEGGWPRWHQGLILAAYLTAVMYLEGDRKAFYVTLTGLFLPWVLGVLYLIGLSIFHWHFPTLKNIDFTPLALLQVTFLVLGYFMAMASRQ